MEENKDMQKGFGAIKIAKAPEPLNLKWENVARKA